MIRTKIAVLTMSLAAAALISGANGAFAEDSDAAASSTKVETETIRGVLPASTADECSATGATYSDQCPGSGSGGCSCFDVTSATASGTIFGNGTVTLFITEDTILAFLNGGASSCTPFFANANLDTSLKKTSVTAKVDIQGTFCEPLTSTANATILGGFAIETGASNGETGFGDVVGSVNKSTGEIIVKLTGQITS